MYHIDDDSIPYNLKRIQSRWVRHRIDSRTTYIFASSGHVLDPIVGWTESASLSSAGHRRFLLLLPVLGSDLKEGTSSLGGG
jgi:hypothetical protein